MGVKGFFRRRADEYNDAKANFELGCQILGRPSNPRSVLQRQDRMEAGRKERERRARLFGEAVLKDIARRAFREAQAQKRQDIQFEANGVKVLVKNGYSRITDSYTTDVIVIDPGRRDQHLHLILDESGEVIHQKWTANH